MDTRRFVCKSPTQARNNGQSGKAEYGRLRRNRECRWLTVAVYELTWKVKERHLIVTGRWISSIRRYREKSYRRYEKQNVLRTLLRLNFFISGGIHSLLMSRVCVSMGGVD
jgi:hypothetical protein